MPRSGRLSLSTPPTPLTFGGGASTPPFVPPAAPPPTPPPSLTQDIPDLRAIATQRDGYSQSLDAQLQQGRAVLDQQLKQQLDFLHGLGEQNKKQYNMMIDQEVREQELALIQQCKQQMLMVQMAAQRQKLVLGQQATNLMLEYNQRKAKEDFMVFEYKLRKEQMDAQVRFEGEMANLKQQQNEAAQLAHVQSVAVDNHAAQAMQQLQQQQAIIKRQIEQQAEVVKQAEKTHKAVATTAARSNASTMRPGSLTLPAAYQPAVTTVTG